jgi:hypothetical protein
MSWTIPIRRLLALRPEVSDRVLLDYLELAVLAREPGQVGTQLLQDRWRCSQSTASRRVNAVSAAGLADITSSWGAYQVHSVDLLEPAA